MTAEKPAPETSLAPDSPAPAAAEPAPETLLARSLLSRFVLALGLFLALNGAVLYAALMPVDDAPALWVRAGERLHCLPPFAALVLLPLAAAALLWLAVRRATRRHLDAALPPLAPWRRELLFLAGLPLIATFARPFTAWRLAAGYLPKRLLVLEALTPVILYYTAVPRSNGWQLALGSRVWLAACLIPWLWAVIAGINDIDIMETPPAGIRWRRVCGPLAGLALITLILTVFSGHLVSAIPDSALGALVTDAGNELQRRFPPLRPEDNAARRYQTAAPLAEQLFQDCPELATRPAAEALAQPLALALAGALDAAGKMPEAGFSRHTARDFLDARAAATVRDFRRFARFRAAQCRVAAAAGDREKAVTALLKLPVLHRHLADTPDIPGILEGTDDGGIPGIFLDELETLLRSDRFDAATLGRLGDGVLQLQAQAARERVTAWMVAAVDCRQRLRHNVGVWRESGAARFVPAMEAVIRRGVEGLDFADGETASPDRPVTFTAYLTGAAAVHKADRILARRETRLGEMALRLAALARETAPAPATPAPPAPAAP